jgi:DNA-binding NtrC family response regulator
MRVTPGDVLARSLRRGDYLTALSQLERASRATTESVLTKADILRNVGRPSEALRLLQNHLDLERLESPARAVAFRIKGEAHASLGAVGPALQCLERAIFEAEACSELEQAALAALSRFTLLANSRGTAESQPALELARRAVLRSGGTQVLAGLYARVGQAHAQVGLAAPAVRHLQNALEVLARDEHLGITAFASLALCGAEFTLARYRIARRWATRAMDAAIEGGLKFTEAAARANLALLEYRLGRNETARALCNELLSSQDLPPLTRGPVLDTLAAVALAEAQYDVAGGLISQVEAIVLATGDATFLSVDAAVTAASYHEAVGNIIEAQNRLNAGVRKAETRGDEASRARLLLMRAELQFGQHDVEGGLAAIDEARLSRHRPSVETLALSARVRAISHAARGNRIDARAEFARAARIFRRSGDRPSLLATVRSRSRWLGEGVQLALQGGTRDRVVERVSSSLGLLADLAAYPDILAIEASQTLRRLAPSVSCVPGTSRLEVGVSTSEVESLDLGVIGEKQYFLHCDFTKGTHAHREIVRFASRLIRNSVSAEQALLRLNEAALGEAVEEEAVEGTAGLYASALMRELLATARHAARTDLPILILGETGTGKEVLAAEIHAASKRSRQAFIPFNVTAVSRDLVESQLFGAKKGSFTGATHDTKGLLREAEGGTVFLDEIGEMSLDVQPKLLRFVEQGEIQPVGERPQHVDVRIIAATNASLKDLVQQGRFREDLYQRLRVVPLTIPPLRDRREEIPALTRYFVRKHAEAAKRPIPDISPRALERLVAADWPGNVRQLNNELKRVVALLPEGATIEVDHLSPELQRPPLPQPLAFDTPAGRVNVNLDRPLEHIVDDVERAAIERVLTVCSGNQSEAARRLGITRKGLYLKLKRLGLATE